MATFYFNGAVDGEWTELGNWWMDDQFSVQATALPTSADDVIASASITSNSGSAPTVANAEFVSGASNLITITVTGLCTFNNTSNLGNITGDCVFNGESAGSSGTITGDCTFNGATINGGTITGDCTFNDNSVTGHYGQGSITGNCIFNHSSGNTGYITGNCVFNDYTFNSPGDYYDNITGDCVFNGGSHNVGGIVGDCVFNDGSVNGYFGFGSAVNCIFNHNSANGGSVNNAVFNDSATLYRTDFDTYIGRVAGNCTLSVASASLTLDGWGYQIGFASYSGSDRIEGAIEIKYDKGINGSSILGVV